MEAARGETRVLDGELARRSRNGDAEAFAQLVDRHRRTVYAVARAVLGSPEEAEDVAQEALIRAYRSLGRYDTSREFAAWIRAITVNCAVTALRRRRRPGWAVAERLPHALDPADTRSSPHEDASAHAFEASLRAEIARLPLKQRLAITLFGLDGLDLAGAAEAIGCSVGATKVHLSRAREKLARALDDHLRKD
jgi:RNA polymerase sigma factor (sigma-70 family)